MERSSEGLTRIFAADHNAGRRFIPERAGATPSDLFFNIRDKTAQTRFKFAWGEKYLIFISGRCEDSGKQHARAAYAHVWGPDNWNWWDRGYGVNELEDRYGPQTADRAQIRAAIKALESLNAWLVDVPHDVVLAYSGDYFLNQIARSNLVDEVERESTDLDLKWELADLLEKKEKEGIRVQFWQVKEADNIAENRAIAWLRETEGLGHKIKRIIGDLT